MYKYNKQLKEHWDTSIHSFVYNEYDSHILLYTGTLKGALHLGTASFIDCRSNPILANLAGLLMLPPSSIINNLMLQARLFIVTSLSNKH